MKSVALFLIKIYIFLKHVRKIVILSNVELVIVPVTSIRDSLRSWLIRSSLAVIPATQLSTKALQAVPMRLADRRTFETIIG